MSTVDGASGDFARDQFLQLLVTQLRHQDPLSPVQDKEFIAQLAQFSTLEGIEKLNASFADLLSLQQLTEGSALLGKTVTFREGAVAGALQGVVQGIEIQDGKLYLVTDNGSVSLDQVQGMTA